MVYLRPAQTEIFSDCFLSTNKVDNFHMYIYEIHIECFMWNTYQQVYALICYLPTYQGTFFVSKTSYTQPSYKHVFNFWGVIHSIASIKSLKKQSCTHAV